MDSQKLIRNPWRDFNPAVYGAAPRKPSGKPHLYDADELQRARKICLAERAEKAAKRKAWQERLAASRARRPAWIPAEELYPREREIAPQTWLVDEDELVRLANAVERGRVASFTVEAHPRIWKKESLYSRSADAIYLQKGTSITLTLRGSPRVPVFVATLAKVEPVTFVKTDKRLAYATRGNAWRDYEAKRGTRPPVVLREYEHVQISHFKITLKNIKKRYPGTFDPRKCRITSASQRDWERHLRKLSGV